MWIEILFKCKVSTENLSVHLPLHWRGQLGTCRFMGVASLVLAASWAWPAWYLPLHGRGQLGLIGNI